jgi:hypothetical protein
MSSWPPPPGSQPRGNPPPGPPPPSGYPSYQPPPPPPPSPGREWALTPLAIAGLAVSAAGFILNLSYSSYQTVNGVQTDCDYHNFGPLLVGPVALVLGVLTLVRARRPGQKPSRELAAGVAVVALGALHLLRGVGVLDIDLTGSNPC